MTFALDNTLIDDTDEIAPQAKANPAPEVIRCEQLTKWQGIRGFRRRVLS